MSDILGYKGKRVVVSGCFSGMGEATAKMLLGLGAEVHGLDFKDSTKSKAAGFQPAFNTSLIPTGQITASLGVALPITVSASIELNRRY